jgi:hypothetical protein
VDIKKVIKLLILQFISLLGVDTLKNTPIPLTTWINYKFDLKLLKDEKTKLEK